MTDEREPNHIKQEEMAMLTVVDGTIELKDQLRDYKFRGEELTFMSFLEFMLETYEDSKDNKEDETVIGTANTENAPRPRGPGRPLSTRIPYQDEAGKGKRCRIRRSQEHETLPRFIGKWFCRSDNDHERDLFRGSMLVLLKPWRDLHKLKGATETFENAFDRFMSQADEKARRVVANIQYYFECSDGAKADRKKINAQGEQVTLDKDGAGVDMDINDGDDIEDIHAAIGCGYEDITDDSIDRARVMRTHARERLYGESAVALGYDVGFFEDADVMPVTEYANMARTMHPEEGENIRTWAAQLKATTREQINVFAMTDAEDMNVELLIPPAKPTGTRTPNIQIRGEQMPTGQLASAHTERTELASLNEEQRRAHDIIEERLKEHITSESHK